ncbi:YoaK family protein [Brevundimonas variabilis]|uniref:Uncharacterized membrane protein YoaK (UPF0700 family) n=1 Tax=Brevundimonas variabilis TaxID=74312 RepID=A0A7W9CJP1_9CAUL|nr:YoaK family protein [Brevundimonas variabilis]MBB5746704.1 uncharacterized membrane protein YoaK (UPF0700 family) [Brevundimonas variabilis]
MKLYTARARALATCLSGLAGFVDAMAYIHLGGFFVSFMSGNTTRLGVSLADGSADAARAGGLLLTFVVGVVLGSMTGQIFLSRRQPAVLLMVALLLAAAAGLSAIGQPWMAAVAMALAMGAENAVFEIDGEVRIGLTYMTGTLVKLGQRITSALLGGDRFGWVPYLLLWMGLAAGGLTGALTYAHLGIGGLWIAAGAAGVLAFLAARMGPDRHPQDLEAV